MAAAVVIDMEYEENRPAGVASHECYVSVARVEPLFIAMEKAWPWIPSPSGEANRAAIPIHYLEEGIAGSPVADDHVTWTLANGFESLTVCLQVDQLALSYGVIQRESGFSTATGAQIVFDTSPEAYSVFEGILVANATDPDLILDVTSFDSFEPCAAAASVTAFGWLNQLPLCNLVRGTKNLRLYVELSRILGPRALDASRVDPAGQLMFAAGNTPNVNGGQLGTSMHAFYRTNATPGTGMMFLKEKLDDFLHQTAWKGPLAVLLDDWTGYALELPARARWPLAGASECPGLVLNRLTKAMEDLVPLAEVMHTVIDQPAELAQKLVQLGPLLLGKHCNVMKQLGELNSILERDYKDLIAQSYGAGDPTEKILEKISPLAKKAGTDSLSAGGGSSAVDPMSGGTGGPKRGTLRKAYATREFIDLNEKFKPILDEPGQPRKKTGKMFSEIFASKSTPPKAVVLATSKARLHLYTDEDTFLPKLADCRSDRRLYFMQCMAYDEASQKVPKDLETLELSEEQDVIFCNFKWAALDVLNCILLPLLTKGAGATYDLHDSSPLYHRADTITLVEEKLGKLFKGVGYPAVVPTSEGVSFQTFMAKIQKLHRLTLAMTEDEAVDMYQGMRCPPLLETLGRRGTVHPAPHSPA